MSEHTDDVLNGQVCSFCGVFFKRPHGHPAVCTFCWDELSREDREGHQRATVEER